MRHLSISCCKNKVIVYLSPATCHPQQPSIPPEWGSCFSSRCPLPCPKSETEVFLTPESKRERAAVKLRQPLPRPKCETEVSLFFSCQCPPILTPLLTATPLPRSECETRGGFLGGFFFAANPSLATERVSRVQIKDQPLGHPPREFLCLTRSVDNPAVVANEPKRKAYRYTTVGFRFILVLFFCVIFFHSRASLLYACNLTVLIFVSLELECSISRHAPS